MPILSKPSEAARAAVIYITAGALLTVWTVIWYLYLRNHAPESGDPTTSGTYYVCYGLLLTGIVLTIIGLAIGRIGRAARHAELPPPEAQQAVENAEQIAAARAPIVVPVSPAVPNAYGNRMAVARNPAVPSSPEPVVPHS